MRPLYSEFFAEAAAALGDPILRELEERYAELGRGWTALAGAALPSGVPLFQKAKEAFNARSEITLSGADAADEMRNAWARLGELGQEARERLGKLHLVSDLGLAQDQQRAFPRRRAWRPARRRNPDLGAVVRPAFQHADVEVPALSRPPRGQQPLGLGGGDDRPVMTIAGREGSGAFLQRRQ